MNSYLFILMAHAELIIATCALITAFFAFLVTVWQSILTKRHNKLSVKPLLCIERHMATNRNVMGLKIENCGVGPAIIKEMKVFYKNEFMGSVKDDTWVNNIGNHGVPLGKIYATLSSQQESLIKVGAELWLLKNESVIEDQNFQGFSELLQDTTVLIKYESIYKEKFESNPKKA